MDVRKPLIIPSDTFGSPALVKLAASQADFSPLTAAYTILEDRQLRFEWPGLSRIGDRAEITLALESNPSHEYIQGSGDDKASSFQDPYSTHTVMAEARLEMNGLRTDPIDLVGQPLLPGTKVRYTWNYVPAARGTYNGLLWFYLRFIPQDGSDSSQLALVAKPIEIHATSLFGLSGPVARVSGAAGFLASFLLLFDAIAIPLMRRLKGI